MKHTTLTILTIAALGLAGCETDNLGPGSTPDPATPPTQEAAAEEAAEEDAPDDLEIEEDSEEAGQFLHEFDTPIVHESEGVRVSITGIGFTSVESDVMDSDVRNFLEDDTQTVLALEMTVSNDSGEQINVYANQGTIQLGRSQVDADLWLSDSFAGEMRDGVDDDGLVVWQLTVPFDEVVSEGNLVYAASAPFSEESFEPIGDDIELTVEWPAP